MYPPFNSAYYIALYTHNPPQNGDRIVIIDSVTSLRPMYNFRHIALFSRFSASLFWSVDSLFRHQHLPSPSNFLPAVSWLWAILHSFFTFSAFHRVSVHQAAKLVAALLRVAGVTAGLAESNDSLSLGLWLTSPAGWLPSTGISSGTLRSVIEYGLRLL